MRLTGRSGKKTARMVVLVVLVALAALLVPILGVLPPAHFFRFDDFPWLTWAATHQIRDAFSPSQLAGISAGFRPVHALFWIFGYRVFGPDSAVPWILLSSSFFAAGLVIMLLWGERLDGRGAGSGVTAVAIWFAGFFPMTYFLLNVFNNGKTIAFFLIPVTIWSGVTLYDRRRFRRLPLFLAMFLVCLFTRESSLAIVPLALGTYVLMDLRERGRPLLPILLIVALSVAGLLLAAVASSPWRRDALLGLVRDPDPSRWLGGVRYYASELLWNGYRRYLWLGLIASASLLSGRRRLAAASFATLLSGFFLPRVAAVLALIVLLIFWAMPGSKLRYALLAWFVAGFGVLLPLRAHHESYFLEASFPLCLFLGLEMGPALAPIVGRVRGFSSAALGAWRWRILPPAAIALALLASATVVGWRVFERELLPIKRHGSDFAEANRFLVRTLPRGSRVYVIDESEYGLELRDYLRRFRRFYLWPGHPECWFAAYGRPDVEVLPWRGEEGMLRPPAYLFASNPHERSLFRERPAAMGMTLLFENRSCAVFGFRDPSGAEATERGT